MRPSPFILVALLLAGCSTNDEFDFVGLPPESYWVVTRTFDAMAMPAGEPDCESKTLTEPALLRFTAPDVVTLSTLHDVYLLNDGATTPTGKVSSGGALTFFGYDTRYDGRFEDPDHFSLTSHALRKFPWSGCPVRVTAYRYPGPRMCEVTTEAEEAALAAEVQEVVAASSLPRFRDAFIGARLQLLAYALGQTAPGTYAQDGTTWTQLTTGDHYVFTTDDGYTLTLNAEKTSVTLAHPQGGELTAVEGAETLHVSVDDEWTMIFDIEWMMSAATYTSASLGGPAPYYVLRRYETPVGSLEWSDTGNTLHLTLGEGYRVTKTERDVTLTRGDTSKTWTHEETAKYCPAPGRGLYDAFPNVLQEIFTLCATTPLYEDRVECMLVGP